MGRGTGDGSKTFSGYETEQDWENKKQFPGPKNEKITARPRSH